MKMRLTFSWGTCWVLLVLLTSVTCAPMTDREKTDATVDKERIKEHVYYLASDEMKGRDVGTPEIQKAAGYIAEKFKDYGVKMVDGLDGYFQPVPLKMTGPPSRSSLTLDGNAIESGVGMLVMDGVDGDFSGDIIYLNYGLAADLEGVDVAGKIVVAKAGSGENADPRDWLFLGREKRKAAKTQGALALIELYNSPNIPWRRVVSFLNREKIILTDEGDSEEESIPHLWIKDLENTYRASFAAKNIKKGAINIEGIKSQRLPSKNVIGMIEGTDPVLKKEFVMFSAHYDHVGIGRPDAVGDSIYNGTRDNAIGTVTVLSAAENIGKYPLKRSALFVLFTAEEKGLLGSKYLADHPVIPNDQIVYCWNSDNGGYNDTTKATIVGLTRTTAEQMVIDACATYGLSAIEDPTGKEQGFFDRSDNVSFAKKGIPAPTFSLGFTSFDGEVTKYYHQPSDNPETIDYDYLFKFFSAYVYASRKIGNATERPFWKEGDKYYEVGKELYGKN